jgi:hypothetical protein
VRCESGRELAWFGSPLVLPALGCGEHWFRLRTSTEGTLFEHGEDFRGLLTPVMPKTFFTTLTRSYEAFNLALKVRSESAEPT